MPAEFSPTPPGCPWGQCEHTANTHTTDHCMGCFCVKPPPPMPAPRTEQVDVDVELELCGLCSAYVEDRDKHVTWHERLTDTMTNLVISISALERQNHKD